MDMDFESPGSPPCCHELVDYDTVEAIHSVFHTYIIHIRHMFPMKYEGDIAVALHKHHKSHLILIYEI